MRALAGVANFVSRMAGSPAGVAVAVGESAVMAVEEEERVLCWEECDL